MELYPDSPKLGQKSDDGAIARWPESDVLGRPYTRSEATLRGVTAFLFVVIPPGGFNEPIEIIQPVAPKAPRYKKVEAATDDE